VLGILLMNVNAFALPFAAYDTPAAYGPMRWPDVALWLVDYWLVDGKFRAIFSALFGAGLILVADQAAAAGRPPDRSGYARLFVLFLFGAAHHILLWAGDILCLYALVGAVALPLRRLAIEQWLVLAGLLFALQAAVLALHYQALAAAQAAAAAPGASDGAISLWNALLDSIGRPSPTAVAAELALHRGPWGALVAARAAAWPGTVQAELILAGPETLGLMLLGMAGLRSGFLTGAWADKRYRWLAGRLYAVGLLPLFVSGGLLILWRFPPLATASLTDLGAMPSRWLIATAHAALLVRWFARPSTRLRTRLTAAGRAGFSNYLGTSMVMALLFDGSGLFGRWERWQLVLPTMLAWALMLAWSEPWLRRFRHGPLEWLWRRLARIGAAPVSVKKLAR
jgi:uncharacterized protein